MPLGGRVEKHAGHLAAKGDDGHARWVSGSAPMSHPGKHTRRAFCGGALVWPFAETGEQAGISASDAGLKAVRETRTRMRVQD